MCRFQQEKKKKKFNLQNIHIQQKEAFWLMIQEEK